MVTRARRSGGHAVRWAYGVFVTLCVVLAVLAHHEVSTAGVAPMPGMAHAAMTAEVHAAHGMPDAAEPPSVTGSSTHGLDDGVCAGAGMPHCAAASVASPPLVVPAHDGPRLPVDLPRAVSRHAPGAVVSRAPPDLSVLSQLRI
ncbi:MULTISPECIES: DUF6153 family protein [unclassified Streptomyces]|uniref:DUF6153 family protein n=1 Tax=unclassified Streptomyces TaxID=2593676 RepID=UPI0033A82BDB